MPSSPKYFYPRQPLLSYNLRSSLIICCLLIGITGCSFGLFAILRSSSGYKCRNGEPRSVSVVWERSISSDGGIHDGNRVGYDGDQRRQKVMGFVGIQTGFGSVGRRRSLRKTWMPSDHQGRQRGVSGSWEEHPRG